MFSNILIKVNRITGAILLALLFVLFVAGETTTAQGLADSRFDLTGNGVIDDSDAALVLVAIARLQEQGLCLSSAYADRDINGDGCVDIFDVQIILSHWGERTRPEPQEPIITPASGVITVNSSGDSSDNAPGDGNCDTGGTVTVNGNNQDECTLRAAVQESNVLAGLETIEFNIRNSNGSCPNVVTIRPQSTILIDASDDAGVTIDGYSQCGASPNTNAISGNADIRIQIEGRGSGENIWISSAKNTIKGLAIYRADFNIYLHSGNARNNTIQGNILGSNAALNWGPKGTAVGLRFRASYNLVGGVAPQERNIFSGSSQDALAARDQEVSFNVIIGNYIGVKQDGRTAGQNTADGVDISHGAKYNWFGASPPGWIAPSASSSSAANWPPAGATWPPGGWQYGDPVPPPDPNRNYDPRERNVISRNGRDGVEISHQSTTQYNYIINNYIGLAASGTQSAGNGEKGITIEDTPQNHFILNNIIVNNGLPGIRGYGLCNYHQIVNNYIGVAPDGVTPMGNGTDTATWQRFGIYFYGGCKYNLFKGNIIANHPKHGIELSTEWSYLKYSHETHFNTISQNSIYNNGGSGLSGVGIHFHSHASGWNPNQGIDSPQIVNATEAVVGGTACPSCKVELFIAHINDSVDLQGGEGRTFIGEGLANGAGNFLIAIGGEANVGQQITATATDAAGNTSEFSANADVSDGQTPIGSVLLNGGLNLQSPYNTVMAQFQAVDNAAVTGWRYQVDNPTFSGTPYTSIPTPSPLFTNSTVLPSLSTGLHTVYAQYKDADNNESVVYNATITIVNVGNPSPARVTVNNGAEYTNNPNLSLQLVGPLYATQTKLGHSAAALSSASWEPYSVQGIWTLNDPYSGGQSFVYAVYAKFRDIYSVETPPSPNAVSDTILYDPVAPTPIVSVITETITLNLSASYDDAGGTGLGMMRVYDPNDAPSNWVPYGSHYTWPGPYGISTLAVQLKDKAGNESAEHLVSIPASGPAIKFIYLPAIKKAFK